MISLKLTIYTKMMHTALVLFIQTLRFILSKVSYNEIIYCIRNITLESIQH